MQVYRYKALSRDGKQVKGVVDAYDEYEAAEKIKADCPVITELEPIRHTKARKFLTRDVGGKIHPRDLSVMCSQFAIMLRAGMPIGRVVHIISRQTPNKRLREILAAVSKDVEGGRSLARSLQDEGKGQIPVTLIETVRAGEQSGNLDVGFERCRTYYENRHRLRAKVVGAMIQPVFTMVVAIIVVCILMIFVVPGFTESFAEYGAELPLMTRVLIAVSNFFAKWWLFMVAVLLLLIIAVRAYAVSKKGSLAVAKWMLHMPLAGKMVTMSAASEFAQTMSTMLGSGLTILQAVGVTGSAMGNLYAGRAVADMAKGITVGRTLGSCMRELEFFPEILREMTVVGEETGSLDATMHSMGEYYSAEAEYATKKFVSSLEPALLCVVAVIAGFIVIAMYMAMFALYGAM